MFEVFAPQTKHTMTLIFTLSSYFPQHTLHICTVWFTVKAAPPVQLPHKLSELQEAAIQPLTFLISTLWWLKARHTSGVNIIIHTTAGDSETHKHTDMRIKMWNFIYSKFKENEIQRLKLIWQIGVCLSLFAPALGFSCYIFHVIVERPDSDVK